MRSTPAHSCYAVAFAELLLRAGYVVTLEQEDSQVAMTVPVVSVHRSYSKSVPFLLLICSGLLGDLAAVRGQIQ
jgi:hypothetical protein